MTYEITESPATTDEKDSRKSELKKARFRTATALSTADTVSLYGSCHAEDIKAYTGIDNQTGQTLDRSHKKISGYKVNSDPAKAKTNIKQQSGFSAEVAATSRDNKNAIVNRSKVRVSRSEDIPQYGKNHNVVDRVKLLDGKVIEGSESQMKFVRDRNSLLKKIAEDTHKGEAKFARYRNVKLELPSEQYEGAADYCRNKARELRDQAQDASSKGAPTEVIDRLNKNADHYDLLSGNIVDSGLTTEEAIYYREHPKMATARDMLRTSHSAGKAGAKAGVVVGGSISILTNAFSVAQDKKQLGDALLDVTVDTSKAAALGYATAFSGSAVKGAMQQSGNQSLRSLANTNAPAMVVNICISLGSSVKRYVTGEISEAQMLTEVGEKGAGMLSSGMMAALGQLALPVPFVGAAIGGMIGYTLSSIFYQSALDAARGVELSRQQLERVRAIQAAARDRIVEERAALEAFINQEMPQLNEDTDRLLNAIKFDANTCVDEVAADLNHYATLLGKKLQFHCMQEFDRFMSSEEPLIL